LACTLIFGVWLSDDFFEVGTEIAIQ